MTYCRRKMTHGSTIWHLLRFLLVLTSSRFAWLVDICFELGHGPYIRFFSSVSLYCTSFLLNNFAHAGSVYYAMGSFYTLFRVFIWKEKKRSGVKIQKNLHSRVFSGEERRGEERREEKREEKREENYAKTCLLIGMIWIEGDFKAFFC